MSDGTSTQASLYLSLPSDWVPRKLREIVFKNRKIRYGIVQPGKFDANGRYLLRGQDYSLAKGWNNPDNLFRVSDEVERRYQKARLQTNDLVITIVGAGTGHVAKIPSWLDGANITQTTGRISIDQSLASPDFVQYVLNSDHGQRQVYMFMKGGAQPGLNIAEVEKMSVPLPPLPEQKKIAAILGTWDKAITKQEKLIAEKEDLKKGLMQQLLTGKKRFPGFTDEWRKVEIQEIGRVIRGSSPRPKGDPRYYGGNVPRLMVQDVTRDGKYVTPSIDFLTEEGAKKSRPCPAGTLTIVCSGDVGTPSFLAVDACIHDGFLAIVDLTDKVNEDYLFYQLIRMKERMERSATHGGVFTNLKTTILKEFIIELPAIDEQAKIAEVLSTADDELKQLNTQLTMLKDQKKGLMQQLLTGKVRVKIDEE